MKPTPEGTQIAAAPETGSRPYLLDTSALLSFIEDEAGADRVEQVLRQPTTIIPWPARWTSTGEKMKISYDPEVDVLRVLFNARPMVDNPFEYAAGT